ncbi:MAG: hypothetical protein HYT29_01555 [Parcubacteria group bacterium]|nr:hypothetical protein [Parcubacteria group bacterium]
MFYTSLVVGLALGAGATSLLVYLFVATSLIVDIRTALKKKGRRSGFVKHWRKTLKKIKQFVAEHPSWRIEIAAATGGWLIFLFTIFILLPPLWRWFVAHPEFFWMPPFVFLAVRILIASEKHAARFLALIITVVFVIALAWAAAPSLGISSGNVFTNTATPVAQTMHPSLVSRERWKNCAVIPLNPALKESKTRLSVPADRESPCYLIREGYVGRISPVSPRARVRLVWNNGRVVNMAEETTNVLPEVNSTRDIAFIALSLVETPAVISVRLEKK